MLNRKIPKRRYNLPNQALMATIDLDTDKIKTVPSALRVEWLKDEAKKSDKFVESEMQ